MVQCEGYQQQPVTFWVPRKFTLLYWKTPIIVHTHYPTRVRGVTWGGSVGRIFMGIIEKGGW